MELRRFALAFIHSHSGATGVFAMLLWKFVAEATSCLQKHCRRHREFYCCLCCWCFRRDTLWISANICVGHVRYCFLFNVVYFFVCTLKNSKTKRLPGGVAEPELRLSLRRPAFRPSSTFGIDCVRSARNKIDKLAASCKFRSFVMIWIFRKLYYWTNRDLSSTQECR